MGYFLQQVLGSVLTLLTDSVLVSLIVLVYFLSNLFEHRNNVDKLRQIKEKTFVFIGIFVILKLVLTIFGPIIIHQLMNNMFNNSPF